MAAYLFHRLRVVLSEVEGRALGAARQRAWFRFMRGAEAPAHSEKCNAAVLPSYSLVTYCNRLQHWGETLAS